MTSATHQTSSRTLRVLTVAVAVVAALTAWILIEQVIGLDLRSPVLPSTGEQVDIGFVEVAVTSLAASLAAWALLALLERFIPRPRSTWTILLIGALLVSLLGPLTGTGVEFGVRVALVFLHLLVAAALLVCMRPTIKEPNEST
jgi:hypothetical protein